MSKNVSRREVLAGGTALAAGAVLKLPQGKEKAPPVNTERIEKLLATPLQGEAAKNLPDAIVNVQQTSTQRWKHKLVENSEPSMVFIALKRDVRSW